MSDTIAATEKIETTASHLGLEPESESTPYYGWGKIRPAWLQKIHKPPWLLFCLCLCCVTQGMLINALIPISISTLERRFHLNSFQTGVFVSAYDVAVCICLIPVTYFGGRGHKGRWLAIGMFIMGIGATVCTLPHFLSEPYAAAISTNETEAELCGTNDDVVVTKSDENDTSSDNNFFVLLLIGQVLHGVGSTPLYTLGITFLDESVSEHMSAMYLGIFFASSVLGPVIGYIGGGMCLRIYGDWPRANPYNMSPDDWQWYGAWWIGFLVSSFMFLIVSILIAGFAKRLPGVPPRKEVEEPAELKNYTTFQKFIFSIKRIFTAWTFVWLVVVDCLEGILSTGVVTFFPKIMENFFRISASYASLVAGLAVVPAAAAGNILGGWIIKRFRSPPPMMLLQAIIADFVCLLLGMCFLLYCPARNVAGVTVSYDHARYSDTIPGYYGLNHSCNANCMCSASNYDPVCDMKSMITYYSPCHAGCRKQKDDWFDDCSCIPQEPAQVEMFVSSGYCEDMCMYIYPFVVVFALFVLSVFSTSIPIQESELRSVPFDLRSLAFGFRWIFIRVLGTIPGPIFFGKFIDSTCLLWKTTTSGTQQECILFQNRSLSTFIISTGAGLKALVLICLFLAWKASRAHQKVEAAKQEMANAPAVPAVLEEKDAAVQTD